ncbi:MAG TPA: CsbD family protein [Promineifilum sp.]
MNEDILQGKWSQLKGQVQQQWGKLTNDDLDRINGRKQELMGVIQERYGWKREKAEMEVNEFLNRYRF